MEFDHFVKELKSIPGLEDLSAGSDGSYSLRINHLHFIFFSPSQSRTELFLYAPLCPIPLDESEKLRLFDHLLSANLFGQETGNGWFASDMKSHQILLIERLPLDRLTVPVFMTALQDFIARLSHWKENLESKPSPVKSTKSNAFYKV